MIGSPPAIGAAITTGCAAIVTGCGAAMGTFTVIGMPSFASGGQVTCIWPAGVLIMNGMPGLTPAGTVTCICCIMRTRGADGIALRLDLILATMLITALWNAGAKAERSRRAVGRGVYSSTIFEDRGGAHHGAL